MQKYDLTYYYVSLTNTESYDLYIETMSSIQCLWCSPILYQNCGQKSCRLFSMDVRSPYVTPKLNNELQCNVGNMWEKLPCIYMHSKPRDVSTSKVYCNVYLR